MEDQQRAAALGEACELITELLETSIEVSPWGVFVDANEAYAGEDTFRPGVQLDGTDQGVSAASLLVPSVIGAVADARKASTLADLIRSNYKNGKAFEKEIKGFLGEVAERKRKILSVMLRSGKARRTLPDLIVVGDTMYEFKRVTSLSLTSQLEAQLIASQELGMSYRIITSGVNSAEDLSAPLREWLDLHDDAAVEVYDSVSRQLKRIYPRN